MHLYGVSPVCKRICLLKLLLWANSFPHLEHSYGLISKWVWTCASRCCFWVNLFPQILHSNGFSPVWMRKCLIRSLFFENRLPHSVHWFDFLCSGGHWYLSGRSGCGSAFSSSCKGVDLDTSSVDTSLLQGVVASFSDTTLAPGVAATPVEVPLLHGGPSVVLSTVETVWLFEKCIASSGHWNDPCSIASLYELESPTWVLKIFLAGWCSRVQARRASHRLLCYYDVSHNQDALSRGPSLPEK